MALPRFTTPYYLAGKAKERFHTNQVEKSAVSAALIGAGGYSIAKHPQMGGFVARQISNRSGVETSPKQIAKAAYIGAAAVAAYGGYHAVRAGMYRHQARKSRTYGLSMPGSKKRKEKKEAIQNYNNQADLVNWEAKHGKFDVFMGDNPDKDTWRVKKGTAKNIDEARKKGTKIPFKANAGGFDVGMYSKKNPHIAFKPKGARTYGIIEPTQRAPRPGEFRTPSYSNYHSNYRGSYSQRSYSRPRYSTYGDAQVRQVYNRGGSAWEAQSVKQRMQEKLYDKRTEDISNQMVKRFGRDNVFGPSGGTSPEIGPSFSVGNHKARDKATAKLPKSKGNLLAAGGALSILGGTMAGGWGAITLNPKLMAGGAAAAGLGAGAVAAHGAMNKERRKGEKEIDKKYPLKTAIVPIDKDVTKNSHWRKGNIFYLKDEKQASRSSFKGAIGQTVHNQGSYPFKQQKKIMKSVGDDARKRGKIVKVTGVPDHSVGKLGRYSDDFHGKTTVSIAPRSKKQRAAQYGAVGLATLGVASHVSNVAGVLKGREMSTGKLATGLALTAAGAGLVQYSHKAPKGVGTVTKSFGHYEAQFKKQQKTTSKPSIKGHMQFYTRKAKVGKGRGRVATQRIKNPNFGRAKRRR